MDSDESDIESKLPSRSKSGTNLGRTKSRFSKIDSDDSDNELGIKHTCASQNWYSKYHKDLSDDDSDNELYRPRKVKPRAPLSNISSDLLQDITDKKEMDNPSRAFEASIKGCYDKAKRTVERSRSYMVETETQATVKPRAYRLSRILSNYRDLEDDSQDRPRMGASSSVQRSGSGMVSSRAVDARAVRATAADDDSDEDIDVMLGRLTATPNRRYYSRSTLGDPDYYDYDLQSSVDSFKTQKRYTPNFSPQQWEQKLLHDVNVSLGAEHVAGKMFTKEQNPDWRYQNSSFLSSALRTDTFWANRFDKLYQGLREKP